MKIKHTGIPRRGFTCEDRRAPASRFAEPQLLAQVKTPQLTLRRGFTCEDRVAQVRRPAHPQLLNLTRISGPQVSRPKTPIQQRRGASQVKALRTLLSGLTFTLTLLCSVSALRADTLQSSNPFLPPGYGEEKKAPPPPPPQVNGPISRELEFRGIVELNGVLEYGLFHKTEQKDYWLEQNQSKSGIQVRGYDRNSKTVTVSMNGRTEKLTLMSPSDTPLPVATSVNPAGNKRNQPPGLPPGLQNPGSNKKNDNDQRRRVVPRRRVILPQN